tara:strand:+ start:680 stop:1165 length:486 start_codon:yes stop_codon:yes gene_type:complete
MENNQITIKENQVIIKSSKSPLAIRITLIVILLICFLIPIAATMSIMFERKGPHIGIFLAFLFFWGIGFYMLRLILWNTFGREIITIEKDTIIYEADFRYFRDGKSVISSKELEVRVIPIEEEKTNLGILLFTSGDQQLASVLKVPLHKLAEIAAEINQKH